MAYTPKNKKNTNVNKQLEAIKSLVSILLFVLFFQSLFMQSYGTPTGSMEKTILIGDKMFFNKFIYGGSTPRSIPFTEIKLPYIQLPAVREGPQGNGDSPGHRDGESCVDGDQNTSVAACAGGRPSAPGGQGGALQEDDGSIEP